MDDIKSLIFILIGDFWLISMFFVKEDKSYPFYIGLVNVVGGVLLLYIK